MWGSQTATDRSIYSTLLCLCVYIYVTWCHKELTHYYLLQVINNDFRERRDEKDALYTFRLITVQSQSHFLMDNLMD